MASVLNADLYASAIRHRSREAARCNWYRRSIWLLLWFLALLVLLVLIGS
ncbi:hypothetical protein JF535_11230 [Microbulbifer salipaludis]|uniref:Uncharacterized protein n=1 Tax=Microbulbifer salipaludis TaxID=187980 RepID=A0ABS3E806_9GAMM|nr:hypothetical protein [Microbulbifer salipaludis]MBN8431424.1 hypothetical protein [Microbulbifer salipaludis]